MGTYPTPWQRKVLWSALTALAIAFMGWLAWKVGIGVRWALGFLQPLLIPVAIAGILAFLLKPLVDRFIRWGARRVVAVLAVFALVFLPVAAVSLWVLPEIYHQSTEFAVKLPGFLHKGQAQATEQIERAVNWVKIIRERYPENPFVDQAIGWGQKQLPELPMKAWQFVSGGVVGFFGMAGLLLGLLLVPIYLYYFLMNAEAIGLHWGEYLPLRASPFKDEVIDCLTEINSYLIAFFRGQLIVTLIDGILVGGSLFALGLNFALIIGMMVAVLQLIPYAGALICWLPAVLIAFAQWQDWLHPLYVTLIFFAVFQFEGFVLAPKIVGESVGLHPMTIIISMVAWSLVIGGLLGALLAVPLTATLKVLLRRYVWKKQRDSAMVSLSAS